MDTFTDIYILDLHGNSNKLEHPPQDIADKNVFDIQEGVAIGLFIKTPNKAGPATVHHAHLWGGREQKYAWLSGHDVSSTEWKTLTPKSPFYFFVPQVTDLGTEYASGWKITDVMPTNGLGFQSHRGHFALDFDAQKLRRRINDLRETARSDDELRSLYKLSDSGWKLSDARKRLRNDNAWEQHFVDSLYRPFDKRASYFSTVAMDRPRAELRQHMLRPNLSLNTVRQTKAHEWRHALAADAPTSAIFLEIKDGSNAFPLYLYPTVGTAVRMLDAPDEPEAMIGFVQRVPNLSQPFVNTVLSQFGFSFVPDGTGDLTTTVGPEDLFHYLYAVLHSPTYRKRYVEYLKTDFPRVPLTRDIDLFRILCGKGAELVLLHLLKSPALSTSIVHYPIRGNNEVAQNYPQYMAPGTPDPTTGTPLSEGRVYISGDDPTNAIRGQYFAGISPDIWEFEIGGYPVCERWLKDRRGRTLSNGDITQYERIIVAMKETTRIMGEIDIAIPSWPLL